MGAGAEAGATATDSGAGAVEAVLARFFFDPGPGAKKPAPRAGNSFRSKRYNVGPVVAARGQHAGHRGRGEPGRFSWAHEGVAYGCCVPALTRFTNPHCPGPPRLTPTPAQRETDE